MNIEKDFFQSNFYLNFLTNKLIPAILIFTIGWFLAGKLNNMIKKAMTKANVDESIISFSNSVLKVVFRGMVILITITCFGINISSIIAALGAALVTVGLALKDNLSNAASGAIIIINKPFKIGDILETSDISGTVEKIEMLFTTLKTSDNKQIVIPNSKITTNYVVNSTANDKRRLDLYIPIKNTTKLSEIKPILDNIIKNNDKILSEPASSIVVDSFSVDSSSGTIKIALKVWCKTKDYASLKENLQENIKNEFDENNIDF